MGVMSHHSLHGTPVLNDVYRATFSEVYNKVTIRNKSKNIIINPYFFIKNFEIRLLVRMSITSFTDLCWSCPHHVLG